MTVGDLLGNLRRLHAQLTEDFLQRKGRSLPLGDMLVDRNERAYSLGFGKGTTIYDSATVIGDVSVGEHCWIGQNTVLDGTGGLTIGDWCTVGVNSFIASHSAVARMLSAGKMPIDSKPTMIGSRCFIGPSCLIEMGVVIGEGCLIDAQSVVKRSLPPGTIAHGNPADVIGEVVLDQTGKPNLKFNRKAVELFK